MSTGLKRVVWLARISHRVSSRGRRGALPSGVFDPRGAERVLEVRRAPRGEKTPLGTMHRRSQQEAGEICGLDSVVVSSDIWSHNPTAQYLTRISHRVSS
jgi:hypothetical protein